MRRNILIGCITCFLAACGGSSNGGSEGTTSTNQTPSVNEALSATQSDLDAVATLLSGTYKSTNKVESNSCSNSSEKPGGVSQETVTLTQSTMGFLTLTMGSSSALFEGKANGNTFTLVSDTPLGFGNCKYQQRAVITGEKKSDRSLVGTLTVTQTVEGDCGPLTNCELKKNFTAIPQ